MLAPEPSESGFASQAPDLPGQPTLTEIFGSAQEGAAIAFTLAQLPRQGSVLWVQDRVSALEAGMPYGPGLASYGLSPDRLVLACGRGAPDVLWALEEGLRCSGLGAVIGEMWGDPRALDFTATKRLLRRAEASGIHAFLIRWNAQAGLSAARRRWRIAALPSPPATFDPKAPGAPLWQADLFRARGRRPGLWHARYDGSAHHIHMAAPPAHRPLDAQAGRGDLPLRGAA